MKTPIQPRSPGKGIRKEYRRLKAPSYLPHSGKWRVVRCEGDHFVDISDGFPEGFELSRSEDSKLAYLFAAFPAM